MFAQCLCHHNVTSNLSLRSENLDGCFNSIESRTVLAMVWIYKCIRLGDSSAWKKKDVYTVVVRKAAAASNNVHFLCSLENRTLAALSLEELACLPQVEPAASVTEAVATSNVSLKCSAFGLPSASVSWWHSNRLVANGSELTHAWEDQYFAISEYRTNAHQVRRRPRVDPKTGPRRRLYRKYIMYWI